AGDDAVLIVLSALVSAVADFQKIFAVVRRLEIYQRIEAIDVLAPGEFLARRVQQGQRRIQGRTEAKRPHVKNQPPAFLRFDPEKIAPGPVTNGAIDGRRQLDKLRMVGVV